MEGLIPLVIHAIKKNRKRSKYRSLSQGSSRGFAGVDAIALQCTPREGSTPSSSHQYRRAMSEHQPPRGADRFHRRHAPLDNDSPPPPSPAADGNMMRRTTSGGVW